MLGSAPAGVEVLVAGNGATAPAGALAAGTTRSTRAQALDAARRDPVVKEIFERGGAPACPVWVFAAHDNRWPNGTRVCAGQGYQANMIVTTINGHRTDASWRFNFSVEGDAYPPCF